MTRAKPWLAVMGAAVCVCLCFAIGIAFADGPTLSTAASGGMTGQTAPPAASASGSPMTKNSPAAITRDRSVPGAKPSISPVPFVPTPPGERRLAGSPKTLPQGWGTKNLGDAGAEPRSSLLVYLNEPPPGNVWYFGPGDAAALAMSDDITLAGVDRDLTNFTIMVACTVGTGTYDVTATFYTVQYDCVGTAIPDATATWTAVPIDATSAYVLSSGLLDPLPTVPLPDNVMLVVTFTNADAGWVAGLAAETGFTEDLFGLQDPTTGWDCGWWFGGLPEDYAGFYAEIYCTGAPWACCTPTGCVVNTQAECDAITGAYFFPGIDCTPNPCCDLGGTPTENETCGTSTNEGCNNTTTPVFSPIVCGTEVLGTYWAGVVGEETLRDTDWYQIVTTQSMVFNFRVQGELPTLFGLVEYTPGLEGTGLCANITGSINPAGVTDPCEVGSIRTACLLPGTYWFFVAPADWQDRPCTFYYTALLTCTTPCPIEDEFDSQVQLTLQMLNPPGTKVVNLQSVCRDDLGVVYRQPGPYTTGTDINTELGFFAVRGTDPVDPDLGRIILTESYGTVSNGKVTNVVASGGNFVSGNSFFDVFVDLDLFDLLPAPGLTFTGVGPFHVVKNGITTLPPYGLPPFTWAGTGGCSGDVSGNGVVNGLDIAGFVRCAIGASLPADNCALADMDCNGTVNTLDIPQFVTALLAGACGTPPCPSGVALIPDGGTEPIALVTQVSHTITQNVCVGAIWDNGRANGDNALSAERRTDGSVERWVVDDVDFTASKTITDIHWCTNDYDGFDWAGTVDLGIWAETGPAAPGVNNPPMTAPLYTRLGLPATRTGVLSHGQMCYNLVLASPIVLPALANRSYFIGVRLVANVPATAQTFWWATAGLTGQPVYFNDVTGALGWQTSTAVFGADYDVNFCVTGGLAAATTGACCYPVAGNYTCDATVNVVECTDLGGTFFGVGTTCVSGRCLGACCSDSTTTLGNPYRKCWPGDTLAACVARTGGTFQGPGTTCVLNPCVQPTGACCFGNPACKSCVVLTAQECELKTDYLAWSEGSDCSTSVCLPACGACCVGTACTQVKDPEQGGVCIGTWTPFMSCADAQCGLICGAVCPTGAYIEVEACGITSNGGCVSTPALFETIPFPATNPLTICGSARTFMVGTAENRDSDWYKFTLTGTAARTVTVSAQAAQALQILLISNTGVDCAAYSIVSFASSITSSCTTPVTLTNPCVPPGTYYLWVGPQWGGTVSPIPCYNYKVTLTASVEACPLGACCVLGVCNSTKREFECNALQGTWYQGQTCPAFACPCGPVWKTQNTNPSTLVGGTVACSGGTNYYCRSFSQANLTGLTSIKCIDFGMESTDAAINITVNLYNDTDANPGNGVGTLIGTVVVPVEAGASMKHFTGEFASPIAKPTTGWLVVELVAPQVCEPACTWMGSNNLGQSAACYILAPSCGISSYATFASIGFPNVHLVMTVKGS